MLVNILEVNRQDEVTDHILASYEVETNIKMQAIRNAGNLFKQTELFQIFKHNYFLKVIE